MCAALTPQKRAAWIRVLSAIQTSEMMEYQVLDPLLVALRDNVEASRFLIDQSHDEKRHGESIRSYLLENFAFEKTAPTFSDRMFYALIFPLARRFLFNKALFGFAILLFYERFSVGLYVQLLKRARKDELFELSDLIESILKDESKHIHGLRKLLKALPQASRAKRWVLKWTLSLVSKDVSFERWAIHNREIRKQLQVLQIDPGRINRRRQLALTKVAHDCTC
jgi:ribonucleotide reductase beta subunit family protein with ferritin-like domain